AAPGHLSRRHPAGPAWVPAELRELQRTHTRSGLPVIRLSRTAIVARVVANNESSDIGIPAPVWQASTNFATCWLWPLSWPPRDRMTLRCRPDQTAVCRKLSSLALLPPPAASRVSFGKRRFPAVV